MINARGHYHAAEKTLTQLPTDSGPQGAMRYRWDRCCKDNLPLWITYFTLDNIKFSDYRVNQRTHAGEGDSFHTLRCFFYCPFSLSWHISYPREIILNGAFVQLIFCFHIKPNIWYPKKDVFPCHAISSTENCSVNYELYKVQYTGEFIWYVCYLWFVVILGSYIHGHMFHVSKTANKIAEIQSITIIWWIQSSTIVSRSNSSRH